MCVCVCVWCVYVCIYECIYICIFWNVFNKGLYRIQFFEYSSHRECL